MKTQNSDIQKKFDPALLGRLFAYIAPHKKQLVLMYICTVLQVAASITIPFLMQRAIDLYIIPQDVSGLLRVSLLMLGTLAVLYFFTRMQGQLVTNIGYKVLFTLRQDLFSKLQQLSFKFFDRQKTGQIITRLTSDIQVLEMILQAGLASFFVDVLQMIGVTGMMLILDVRLSMVLFFTIPMFTLLVLTVRRKILIVARGIQGKLGAVNGFMNESISGVKVIRSFSREDKNSEEFNKINNGYYQNAKRFYPLMALFWESVTIISIFSRSLVLLGGGLLLYKNLISIGVIAAFLTYINQFFNPMQKISNLINELSRAMASCERVFEIMDEELDIQDEADALSGIQIQGKIRFDHVYFQYNKDEKVLEDLCLDVDAGQTIAVVGPTGAGKSTLVNLLCRFYDTVQGAILVDGINIRNIKQAEYRSQLAIVMQDAVIFSGTILENIRYGKPDTSLDEVHKVARSMGIDDMFMRFPKGYDTPIGERGGNLSLGQKQLIAFARSLVRDPRLLILDEASAYIDTQTEVLVQNAMRTLRKGRTTFIIAHRLSTIRDADKIVVIDSGRICESGSHEQLVQQNGHYAHLLKTQYAQPASVLVEDSLDSQEACS